MKFHTHNEAKIDTLHTQMLGTIQATQDELERAFGEPRINDAPNARVPMAWDIQFADGEVAMVYLWKDALPQPRQVVSWHIGARHSRAVFLVHEAFRVRVGMSGALLRA